jgi:hypothetical protein
MLRGVTGSQLAASYYRQTTSEFFSIYLAVQATEKDISTAVYL